MTVMDDLVATLHAGTRAGEITWDQADTRGRSFTTERGAGSILLVGPGSEDSNVYRLTAKDADGRFIDDIAAAQTIPGISAAMGVLLPAGSRELPALYETVREAVTNRQKKLRALTEDFKSDAGSGSPPD
jgi:hypothetical protein